MNQPHVEPKAGAREETLVISRTDEGFRVYAPADPTKSYVVSGRPENPLCTCPDFTYHEGDPGWRCKHIQAVLNTDQNDYDRKEREAIQREAEANGGAHMLVKRSVSPDGRIDSLSVEFSSSVEGLTTADIKARAQKTLELQSEIVARFLAAANHKPAEHQNGKPTQEPSDANGVLPAQMLAVSGITTKWGRRLYIAVQSNGQNLKLFGSRKQLAEAIMAIKPSEDGRYLNIERVLPIETPGPDRRGWR